jgi:hypothetical protein
VRDHKRDAAYVNSALARQLLRGVIGFGLIGSAFALTPSAGPVALLGVLPGMVALRGCPMCWIAGLIQVISAGRLQRTCTNGWCALEDRTAPARSQTSRPRSGP